MSDYKEVKQFLDENNATSEQMDAMWKFMYDKNWKIKNLTDCGKDWTDLNKFARKSLIDIYNKEVANVS